MPTECTCTHFLVGLGTYQHHGTFVILLLVKSRFSVQNSIEIRSVLSEKKGIN